MTNSIGILDPPGRRDELEAETPTIRALIRQMAPELKSWQRISDGRSWRVVAMTGVWLWLTFWLLRRADHWVVAIAAFTIIAALQHRINIIHHEAIHYLLFTRRWLNDLVGHYLIGASILTPATYRLYHFKHHRELGRDSDPDFPGYSQFPMSRWGVARFLVGNLIGLGIWTRFLAESRSAIRRTPDQRAYHERRGWGATLATWAAVVAGQGVVAAVILGTGGTFVEFLVFWVIPELTLTRTLMAVRLSGEHGTRGDEFPPEVRYLVTLPSNTLERFFFSPLNFNYHAEHHLFPAVPWHRLAALHARLMQLPEYARLVGIRRGYLAAVWRDAVAPTPSR